MDAVLQAHLKRLGIEYPSADEATICSALGPPVEREIGAIPVELRRCTGVSRDPECGCHFDIWRLRYSLRDLGPDVEIHVLQEVAEGCVKGHSCRGSEVGLKA